MRSSRFMLPPIIGLSALLCSGAFAAGNYTQNFATAPTSWNVANDTWTAAGDYRNSAGVLPPAISWYTGNSWTTNFTYKVRAYSQWPAEGNELGVVFGLTDSTHYFRVVLSMDGAVDLSRIAGNPNSPASTTSGSVTPASVGLAADTWFDLEVFVNGNAVTVKVNGKVAIAGAPITPVPGMIGVIARADLARFDDLSITDNLATQLFRGTFTEKDGTAINLSAPNIRCSGPTPQAPQAEKNCYANITGDDQSGYSWPIRMWGDGDREEGDDDDGAKLQYISRSTTGEVTDFVGAAIETRPGRVNMNPDGSGGNNTHVIHQWQIADANARPQVPYIIRPRISFTEQHDLYMRFWLKYPDGLTGWWQMPWQFKTSDHHSTDPDETRDSLRVSLLATPNATYHWRACPGATAGKWHWLIEADPGTVNVPGDVKWQQCNPTAEVPFGRWFKVEVFFHRATSATGTGRVWVAIDSNEILDYTVQGNAQENGMYAMGSHINRIMLPQMYGGDVFPRDQYVDDLEIWDGFPASASAHD